MDKAAILILFQIFICLFIGDDDARVPEFLAFSKSMSKGLLEGSYNQEQLIHLTSRGQFAYPVPVFFVSLSPPTCKSPPTTSHQKCLKLLPPSPNRPITAAQNLRTPMTSMQPTTPKTSYKISIVFMPRPGPSYELEVMRCGSSDLEDAGEICLRMSDGAGWANAGIFGV